MLIIYKLDIRNLFISKESNSRGRRLLQEFFKNSDLNNQMEFLLELFKNSASTVTIYQPEKFYMCFIFVAFYLNFALKSSLVNNIRS